MILSKNRRPCSNENERTTHTHSDLGESHKQNDERKKPDAEENIPRFHVQYIKHNMAKMNLMLLETGIVGTFQRRGCEEAPAQAASTFYILIRYTSTCTYKNV